MLEVIEPFRTLLAADKVLEACALLAATPIALYSRAQARLQAGDDEGARSDLVDCHAALGDEVAVELAYLDIRTRNELRRARDECQRIADSAHANSALRARALHILGLAHGKLRRTSDAVSNLIRSDALYRSLGLGDRRAEVQDTLGSVFAARGRLDQALTWYSLSLAHKVIGNDQYGLALTLGNIGRVHLRAGRFDHAIDCLELDLQIALRRSDLRGEARVMEDLGRARAGKQDLNGAERDLCAALELARTHSYRDIEFFVHLDLAMLRLAQGRFDDAERELALSAAGLTAGNEPYHHLLLKAARGRWLLACSNPEALELVERTLREVREHDLPDVEIPLLLDFAEALCARRWKANAEVCLERAARLSRNDGLARYLPRIRESRAKLALMEGMSDERGRLALPGTSSPEHGYVLLERLGRGGFGEVWRAFDPELAQVVAVKRLLLERVYDSASRRRILASARVELEAASRLRHPGIARVMAIGADSDGGAYVVQEFVEGISLHKHMELQPISTQREIVGTVVRMAQALHALHEHDIVHRDLKPSNILLRASDGTPVLIDFGIARVPTLEREHVPGIAGTLAYMSPEQAAGRKVGPSSDIYSLGVVVHEWLCGGEPVTPLGPSVVSIALGVCGQLQDVRERRPDVDAGLAQLVAGMLDKDADARPTAEDVAIRCQESWRRIAHE